MAPVWRGQLSLSFIALILGLLNACNTLPPESDTRGPQWILYSKANSPLAGDTINTLVVSSAGQILIATTNGANILNQRQWLVFTDTLTFVTPLSKSRNTLAVVNGSDGSTWFGMAGGGVKRFNPRTQNGEHWVTYKTPVLSSDFVFSLATDISGSVYVGTSSGVSRFFPSSVDPSQGTWFKYTSLNSPIPDEEIRSAAVNPNDNVVWFGTQSHGVVSFDGDLVWGIDQPNDSPFPIVSLSFGRQNDIWFGTYADWAYRYLLKTNEWIHVADTSRLKNNFVNAIAASLNGTVWFGTNSGLVRFQNNIWTTLLRENSQLPSDTIRALAIDFNENLWIGTTSGVAEYNEAGTK